MCLVVTMASGHRENNYLDSFWQIKQPHSCWLFGFMGRKMALSLGKSTTDLSHFSTYKSNANTTDLNTKLLKTVTGKVLESK